jgi:hypothetical protein
MSLFFECFNYITIIMLTSTPWLLLLFINLLLFFEQIDQVSLATMGFECFKYFKIM